VSHGGRKQASRRLDAGGIAIAEFVRTGPTQVRDDERLLQVPAVRDGDVIGDVSLAAARERCMRSIAELPAHAMKLSPGDPAIDTVCEEA
jgi:nicotinate phosphoribosyltransferase